MLKKIFPIAVLLFIPLWSLQALEQDFFDRQKALKKEEGKRLKGASTYSQKRKKASRAKAAKAQKYKSFRKQQKGKQQKKDAAFAADFSKPDLVDHKKMRAAQEYARQKRKEKEASWKVQNLEFGIKVPDSKTP